MFTALEFERYMEVKMGQDSYQVRLCALNVHKCRGYGVHKESIHGGNCARRDGGGSTAIALEEVIVSFETNLDE